MKNKNFRRRKHVISYKKKKKNEYLFLGKNPAVVSKFKRTKLKRKNKTINFNIITFLKFIFILILFLFLYGDYQKNINKIIVSIFAGRKKHLEILMVYLKYLLYHNKISEIHLWQFSNNKKDNEYLKSISNLHKTNGNFMDYAEIYPEIINNNTFEIKIKMKNNGSCILINDKYEIIFNIDNANYTNVTLNINNNYYSESNNTMCKETKFVKYIFKIIDNKLIIKGKNNFEIKQAIDEKYFNSIKIKSLSNSETFWDYKEVKNKNIKLYDTIHRARGGWYEMFKYYLDYDFDILLKMDDDIVYLDIERFDEFINYIKLFEKNITFPNMVNHAISLFYNNKYDLVPDSLIKEKYQKKNSPMDIFNYYTDGNEGIKIHEYFLNNIDKFTHNNLNPVVLNGFRPSICAFGITKESFIKVYAPRTIWPKSGESYNYLFDDERYSDGLLNNYLYPRFICIHYAFGPQRAHGLGDQFLEKYKNLSNKYIITLNS